MEFKDIFKILILFIIFIIFIIWLIYYLYSIRLLNRVKSTTIKSTKLEQNSIFDDLSNWYLKEKNKFMNKILNNKVNSLEKVRTASLLVDSVFSGILVMIIYLLLSLFYLAIPNISYLLLFGIIGFLIPNAVGVIKQYINKRKIERDLLKAITLINNGLSSGKSIRESIVTATDKLSGPIKVEFEEVVNDLEHGLSLQVAFSRMQKRTEVEDVIYLTTTLSMLSKTGGNILMVFNYLEKIFKTRKRLNQELNASIASSKLVFIIMLIMPVVVFIGMMMLYNNYLRLFFMSSLGNLLLMLIVILYVLYIIIIKNVMKIDKY